jgi:hypothetical protein
LKELFNGLLQFVSDSRNRLSHRMSVVLISAVIVFLLDHELGISFHYEMDNKINELEKVNSIIQNPLSDSLTEEKAITWRQEIFARKSFSDYFFSRKTSPILKNAQTNKPAQIPSAKEAPIMSYFVFYTSSSILFIGVDIFFFILSIFYQKRGTPLIVRLGTAVLYVGSSILVNAILVFFLLKIPMLGNDWTFNYILDFIAQSLIVMPALTLMIYYA